MKYFENALKSPPNYESIIGNSIHSLAEASKEILQSAKSDKEHNEKLLEKGLIVNIGSRAANMISLTKYGKLSLELDHNLKWPNSLMHSKTVRPDNLYQLKSGPNKGAYLGANLFDLSKYDPRAKQKYIATEAPYDKSDYFRMVIDTKSKILVSVTTDDDNKENGVFESIRGKNNKVDLHHLRKGESFNVDEWEVKCTGEEQLESLTKKYIEISKESEKYIIHHIIFKNWFDDMLAKEPKHITDILDEIEKSERQLNLTDGNPIIVNCGFGYGRTTLVILFDQIKHLVKENATSKKSFKDINIEMNLESIIYSLQNEIAYGAGTEVNPEEIKKKLDDLNIQVKYLVEYELCKSQDKSYTFGR